ncbi:MAG: hypothetical protein Q7J34_03020 [Bacteroidales bacterium]|jgi:hypothetical protein|nr:hypothetical protein [Bacteroidales bacterium]
MKTLRPYNEKYCTDRLKQKGLLPETALNAGIGLGKLASKIAQTTHQLFAFILAMSNVIASKTVVGYNLGLV